MADAATPQPQVLIANLQAHTKAYLEKILLELNCYSPVYLQSIQKFIEEPPQVTPVLSIVDGQSAISEAAEWVQTLKMTFPVPLLVIHGPDHPVDFASFKKNGADHLIHFHYDREFIPDLIFDMAPIEFGTEVPLAALNTLDNQEIHPEMEVNFDVFVYLPGNKKTILLRKKGSRVEEKTLSKIQASNQHLYFKKTEKKQFLEYARTALTMKDTDQSVAMTEKLLKSKKVIFEIMSEFFNSGNTNFEAGKKIFERAKTILTEYNLDQQRTTEQAFKQIVALTGQSRSFYQDAIAVSNIAALLGHLLEMKPAEIETLALSGLLFNIGLSELTEYVPGMDPKTLSPAGLEKYKKYPDRSVYMVKSQKVPLPPEVSQAISQHQESPDGKGFPNGLGSDKISSFARLLRLALNIYEMTSFASGQNQMTFNTAMAQLKDQVTSGQSVHDTATVMKIFKKIGPLTT